MAHEHSSKPCLAGNMWFLADDDHIQQVEECEMGGRGEGGGGGGDEEGGSS